MSRSHFLLLLCLSVVLSLAEARPSDQGQGGHDSGFQSSQGGPGGPPAPPGQINGGDNTEDCPPGYIWQEWRGKCVRIFVVKMK